LLGRVFPSVHRYAIEQAKRELGYADRLCEWEEQVRKTQRQDRLAQERYEKSEAHRQAVNADYAALYQHWEQESALLQQEYDTELARWHAAKARFDSDVNRDLAELRAIRDAYLAKDRDAVQVVATLALRASQYPVCFPRNIEVSYEPETRILIVSVQLPDFQTITVTRPDGRPTAQREKTQLQDEALYAIALRTLHEVTANDSIDAVVSVVVNGWVHFIDRATGNPKDECILSIHATKEQIITLQIQNVSPSECFRALRGVAAKNLSAYVPVPPILMLNKEDDRVVAGKKVIEGLSEDDNLAVMEWDAFEHLVGELFEKEFGQNGAEVKVTRASRDRGVDAIAFDPDPIRGGKFVIQAKRYTSTVDVSAVRDLFGTINAEGANKGILVTTSHFGPEAYEFAKGKPITLLNGSNLLHLLQKHGYKFRIDLSEARKSLGLKAPQQSGPGQEGPH
jgi:restriction system protein